MSHGRIDLSDWVIHFIHRRNPDNDPAYIIDRPDQTRGFPFHTNAQINERLGYWHFMDSESHLAPDEYPYGVLMKILQDGHIRSGWSFRNNRATIYGPRPAVCFTEMPLYGLIDYARDRRDDQQVDTYGIALQKVELFRAGGRPVIYGLTGNHKECGDAVWPRLLCPECGIGEGEQFRYVAFNLREHRPIDWTHEREWRWCDARDELEVPGLPLWLKDAPRLFSRILLVVPTRQEAEGALDRIKEAHDSGNNTFCVEYDRDSLVNTYVLSLEEILSSESIRNAGVLRLDDLPAHHLATFAAPVPSAELIEQLRAVLPVVEAAAVRAAEVYRSQAPRTKSGHIADVFGFADLVISEPQTELVQALLAIGAIKGFAGIGYMFSTLGRKACQTGILGEAEAAAEAAKVAFKAAFPDASLSVRSIWD